MGKLYRTGLPRQSVIDAALAAGLPAKELEVNSVHGKPWKAVLVHSWGWNEFGPAKDAMGRAVADKLQAMGLCCAFDVVYAGGLRVIFDLQEVTAAVPESTWQPDLFGRPASSVAQQRGLFGEG